MWCEALEQDYKVFYGLLEERSKIQLMHQIFNWSLTEVAGEISSPITGISSPNIGELSPKLQFNWSTEQLILLSVYSQQTWKILNWKFRSNWNSTDWSTPNWNLQVALILIESRGLSLPHLSGWNCILIHDLTMAGSEFNGLARGPLECMVTKPKGGIRFQFARSWIVTKQSTPDYLSRSE